MDITLIIYVSRRTPHLAALMAEVFDQSEGFEVEIIMVDGGTMRVDFEKVGKHCRDHGIDMSVVRQDPLDRHAPGFQAASKQAQGGTLVFMNPALRIPHDFLKIADYLGSHGKAVLPRAWMNVASRSTECWGFWTPPDGMSLITPARYFHSHLLDNVAWSSTPWPKADAYVLASKIATEHSRHVGMAAVGDFEYRSWMSSERVATYMPVIEHDMTDVNDWVLSHDDIRRYTVLGVPFERVVEPVPAYTALEAVEPMIRQIVMLAQERNQHLGEPEQIAPAVQQELDDALDNMFKDGTLIVRPEFAVEPVTDGGQSMVRVRSTGKAFLPHEMVK